jgi:hypothetical protein
MHKSEEIILKDKNFDTKQGQNSTINTPLPSSHDPHTTLYLAENRTRSGYKNCPEFDANIAIMLLHKNG